MPDSDVALLLATGVHAGFQLTVTVLVYPALAEVAAEQWPSAHARHSRRITPLVGVVYVGLLAAGVWTLLAGPGPWGWAALAATAGAVAVTATRAAPTHGELGRPGLAAADLDRLRRRLLRDDRVRCALAVLGALGALAAAVPAVGGGW